MIKVSDAKRIIDHFYIGRLEKLNNFKLYFKVRTNQGTFLVLKSNPFDAIKTEKERRFSLEKKIGPLKRILLPDYTNELNEDSSYAHYKDYYYSVYKIENE